ncbi:MAG: TAXI family TRAP transporter solute-binding subunit [Rhodospirillales bacterium]|nr:TAXI family TRAP transporter solute-binding subunit [Alphaproteobacteria bacterium]MBL6928516.1 TAXI family TRAP transporter solute-binding subunit [Rhodospirillales bacterium]
MLKLFSLKSLSVAAAVAVCVPMTAMAADLNFFTIGTGGTAYTYYPVGGMIANAISKPPGSRECGKGGSCGVDGLIASAVSSRGSGDNVNAITSGIRNSGFVQSDVAYWAYTGTGVMEGKEPMKDLRAISALFAEHIHLIALKDSPINSVADLKGKRVSIDEPGSGVYIDSKLVLESYGLAESDITAEHLKGNAAADALRNGKIDAYFVVTGYPSGSIVELASSVAVKMLPIDGAGAQALMKKYGFFAEGVIPAGAYEGVDEVKTVFVGAQWITSAKESTELIYNITKAMWNKESRKLFDGGHAKGKVITLETALNGVGIPLHLGAEKYYKEAGLIK